MPVYIDCYGGGDYTITVGGKPYRFEWSEQLGADARKQERKRAQSISPL